MINYIFNETVVNASAAIPYQCNGTAVKFFDITIPNERSYLDDAAIFYSAVPWVFALILVIATIATRVIFGGLCVFINEAIIKQAVSQPRPDGSCLDSKGMPSSHSFLAIGGVMWITLEIMFHQNKRLVVYEKVLVWIVFASLLIPVPSARVQLYDHSPEQVGVGSALGIGTAILYFLLLHYVLRPYLLRFAVWSGFTYDYYTDGPVVECQPATTEADRNMDPPKFPPLGSPRQMYQSVPWAPDLSGMQGISIRSMSPPRHEMRPTHQYNAAPFLVDYRDHTVPLPVW